MNQDFQELSTIIDQIRQDTENLLFWKAAAGTSDIRYSTNKIKSIELRTEEEGMSLYIKDENSYLYIPRFRNVERLDEHYWVFNRVDDDDDGDDAVFMFLSRCSIEEQEILRKEEEIKRNTTLSCLESMILGLKS